MKARPIILRSSFPYHHEQVFLNQWGVEKTLLKRGELWYLRNPEGDIYQESDSAKMLRYLHGHHMTPKKY